MVKGAQGSKLQRINTEDVRDRNEKMSRSGNPEGTIENLVPFNAMPKSQHLILSKQGGRSVSKAKSDGAKWRFLKQRIAEGKVKADDAKWIVERIENDKAMAFEIITYLDEIKTRQMGPTQEILLAKTYNDVQKTVHGEKIKSENVNYNIDVNDAIRQAFLQRKKQS